MEKPEIELTDDGGVWLENKKQKVRARSTLQCPLCKNFVHKLVKVRDICQKCNQRRIDREWHLRHRGDPVYHARKAKEQKEWRAKNRELDRQRKRDRHKAIMADPEKRAKYRIMKNEQERRRNARKREERNAKKKDNSG